MQIIQFLYAEKKYMAETLNRNIVIIWKNRKQKIYCIRNAPIIIKLTDIKVSI